MAFSNDGGSEFPPELIKFMGRKWVVSILREFEIADSLTQKELKQKFAIPTKTLANIFMEMNTFGLLLKHRKMSFSYISILHSI